MNAKPRILFVDDEPNILAGLRRMLRGERDRWQMDFAASGPEALARLEEMPFDVVVSDMRMPGMDGARLLTEVSQRHPATVRIVLSGQSDLESVMKSVGPTHQYLTKPCDVDVLTATVERALALRRVLTNHAICTLVTGLERIPSFPALYQEIVQAVQSPETPLKVVGEIIGRDPGMSTKILQLVNSAFFGLGRPVASPAQAVSFLGLDTIRALVLSVDVFEQFDPTTIRAFRLESLWTHSLAVGTLAHHIATAEQTTKSVREESLLAGLLHDVGKLILVANLPHEYEAAQALANRERICVTEAQRQVFGSSHPEVGAYLLRIWGIPDAVVEAVAFHHQPEASPADHFNALTAVHTANALESVVPPDDPARCARTTDDRYLERLGLIDHLDAWRAMGVVTANGAEA
ncbi:MAG: response regulator [Nitrospirota bacterium]|jgi:putative nucleotidyltransferase with HDIG domain